MQSVAATCSMPRVQQLRPFGPVAARLRSRAGARAALRPQRARRFVLRASADTESPVLPAAVAVVAPVAAVAASSALIGSGAISTDAISAYLHATAGFVFDAGDSVPEFVVKYFHGLNMATVLFAMGGYGTYLGWKIRGGNGGDATFGTPDSAAELHPKLMAGCLLFFLAGGQGGLLFNLLQNKPLLESPHAVSALAGLMLLGANGALSAVMGENPQLRTAHAFLGTSLMAVLVVHAGLGLKLALEL